MNNIKCSNLVDFLKPSLQQFTHNLQRYSDVMEWSDLPHYYNERSTLSLFAAACWQRNLIAVEEFVTSKGWRNDSYSGRGDLWAFCPDTKFDICIEAKQRWPASDRDVGMVHQWLKEADNAAAANYDAGLRAGLTFLVPSVDPTASRAEVVNLFERLHDEALAYGVDALAWWLPKEAMQHVSQERRTGRKRIWPGVLAVLRVAKVRGRARIAKEDRLTATPCSERPALA